MNKKHGIHLILVVLWAVLGTACGGGGGNNHQEGRSEVTTGSSGTPADTSPTPAPDTGGTPANPPAGNANPPAPPPDTSGTPANPPAGNANPPAPPPDTSGTPANPPAGNANPLPPAPSQTDPTPPEEENVTYIETFNPVGWRDTAPVATPEELQAIATANIKLAADLYHAYTSGVNASENNLAFSPYDISQMLAMIAVGAHDNTLAAVLTDLKTALPAERLHPAMDAAGLDMINRNGAGGLKQLGAIWGQTRYKFAPLFLETLARYYGPEITGVDFYYAAQAAFDDSIKPWIKDNVGIQDLLYSSDISNRTRLTTASATVLDATWQFDTIQGRFEPLDKKPVLVSMLTRTDLFNFVAGDGYRAFELPFQNSDLALLVIMPDSGRFKEVQAALTSERLQAITAGLAPTQTTVYLPLFNIDAARSSLTSMLTALSRSGAFSEGQADFSGVNNAGYLFLQALNHKTVLSLKETGVKETAATAVVHQATKDEPPSVWSAGSFLVDSSQTFFSCDAVPYFDPALVLARPFLFALRDRQTGSILAMGQLTDPGGGTPVAPDQLINTCP